MSLSELIEDILKRALEEKREDEVKGV